MRYVPWGDLKGEPNIIVDGYPAEGTLITLSHWDGSGSPAELAGDLSTQIAFNYLDHPEFHVPVDAVSNNHFDEDGLSGIYAVVHPAEALARREQIIEVASTGDFGVFSDREAARVAFALMTISSEDRSPLGSAVFERPYPEQSAAMYEEGLAKFPSMLSAPDRFRSLWEDEDAWFERSEKLAGSGEVTIEEIPSLDLAVVRIHGGAPDAPFDSEADILGVHQASIHNRTQMFRVLVTRGNRHIVRYRYETWVKYVSRPTAPRVDLSPLADELTARETSPVKWKFDGNDSLTPKLRTKAGIESTLSADAFVAEVTDYLRRAG